MKHLWEEEHSYYCSDENYYTTRGSSKWGAPLSFSSWQDFLDAFEKADFDMNLLFRFDWKKVSDEDLGDEDLDDDSYESFEEEGSAPKSVLSLYFVLQRKGTFLPVTVNNMKDEDEPSVIAYLRPRLLHLRKLWAPLDGDW